MPPLSRADPVPSETARIEFLMRRDGEAATRAWVGRTLQAYRGAIDNPRSHASSPEYRPLFLKAIAEFEAWLTRHDHPGTQA